MNIRRLATERFSRRTLFKGIVVLLPLLLLTVPVHAHAGIDDIVSGVASVGYAAISKVFGFLAYFILLLSSMMLGLAGMLFNWTVTVTIFQFGQILGNSEGMLAAWGVMRDVGNIILLFGFIFMGLLVILDAHHYPVKKTLPAFIIFAVLLNFSLFFTEFVIDASNALAASVYMESGVCPKDASRSDCAKLTNFGISGKVLEMSGTAGIFDVASNLDLAGGGTATIGLALLVTITAVVLFAGAIMLLIRCIVLAFLMVTSPIAFVGFAVPQLGDLAQKWWHSLINQSFFAPAFLLLILVSLKLMEGVRFALGCNKAADGTCTSATYKNLGAAFNQSGQSEPTVLITFALMIGFMVASLIVAKKMGAVGAGFATNVAATAVFAPLTRATNFAAGGGAMLARRTIQSRVPNNRLGQVAVNRLLRPIENANLDVRRAGVGGILSAAGATSGAKAAEHASFADMRHKYQDFKEGKTGKALEGQYYAEVRKQKLEDNAHHNTLDAEDRRYLSTLSTKELEALHGIKSGVDAMAQNLTAEQFKKLMDSDNLTTAEKGALREKRYEPLRDAIATGNGAEVRNWSAKDLEMSGVGPDARLANLVSDTQYDDLMKEFSAQQKDAFKRAREGQGAVDPGGRFSPTEAAATLATMNPDAIAKLSNTILGQNHVFRNFDITEIAAIQKAGKLDRTARQAIGAHVQTIAATASHADSAKFTAYINSDPSVKQFWNIP
jgi:hypothetical protein